MKKVLVIDFGSQYCKLIARRVRELGVFSEIYPANKDNIVELAKEYDAIILSGGPNSVYDEDSLTIDKNILELGIPVLGTCYGMQIIHHILGGKVEKLSEGEYGKVELEIVNDSPITNEVKKVSNIWMSHFDTVVELAPGFELIAKTKLSNAITSNKEKNIYTIQFHPEVEHTEFGFKFIENFIFNIAKIKPNWTIEDIASKKIKEIKEQVGDSQVILGLSGGVDSSVVAALLHKAIGDQLIPIYINNGLMRKNETEQVEQIFTEGLGVKLNIIDASERFYEALKGIDEPEQKRKIIGRVFIEEFSRAKLKFKDAQFLAQGTIYPDVIESAGVNGTAHVIKSHHNVGGLPEELEFKLCEPLRDLFKDEVRKLGIELGLPKTLVMRHPFPGPGLGIRIIGEITKEKVRTLQEADYIFMNHLIEADLYDQVSQAAAILTPIKTVGVQGDERTYRDLLALRVVKTNDFMTATFARLDFDFLDRVATEIINKVDDINRVVYDITSKPPGTIEWE